MTTDDTIDPLLEAVESLTDLFRRRLLDDKDKRRAFDVLYEQVEHSKSQVDGTLLRPLAMDCIRVIDRLDRYNGDEPEFVESLREELFESLSRISIMPIKATLNRMFDPETQEVSEIRECSPDEQDGTIIGLVRRGYTHDDRVIRPTLVVITGPPPLPEPDLEDTDFEPNVAEILEEEPFGGMPLAD